MIRGTKNLTRQQIQDALDKNFARLGGGMGGDGRQADGRRRRRSVGALSFTVETKRANLPAVLEILRQILREPTLPESEFEVMKNERIAGLEQGRSDPMRQGINHLQRLLSQYPSDDVRYVPTIDEHIERLKEVTLDQVRSLYRDYLGASHGELVIVGDFEPSEVLPILAKTFEGWKADKPYARIERPFQPDLKPSARRSRPPTRPMPSTSRASRCRSRTTIPTIRPWSPATSSWAAAHSRRASPIACARRAGSRIRRRRSSRPARSIPGPTCMILAIYNPINVAKVVTGVDEELARLLTRRRHARRAETAKTGYLQQQEVMRTNDMMLAVVAGGKPLRRPDHAVPGRSRSEDQGPDRRGRQRRPPQAHRPQAALGRHRGRFQGNEVEAGQWPVASDE